MQPNLAINAERLLRRIEQMGKIGDTGDGGSRRLALTEEDKQGRDLLVSWMRDLDMAVRIDAIGNIFGIWPADGAEAPVMCGSHIDTVATGGRYDGVYGVVAGVEVIETLREAGITPNRPIAVAAFTNEEGSRFQPDMLGSLVHAGGLQLGEALSQHSVDGVELADALEAIGYAGQETPGTIQPKAYVELHIEQGPVLDAANEVIGVVKDLQGISWSEITIHGASNHAGTTPMNMRRDAGRVAAEIHVGASALAEEIGGGQVCTIGRVEFEPNFINVIPKSVRMTLDLRNPEPQHFAEAEARVFQMIDAIAAKHGCTATRRELCRFEPVRFDDRIVALIDAVAHAQGHSPRHMTSGAGHDAQMMARICPAAMIFVPSVDGISHNPAEYTRPEHLAAGANVLLHTLMHLSGGT